MASTNSLRSSEVRLGPHNETRNSTACMACRKRKIKCHMLNSDPPCTRCRARNLACTVARKRNDAEDEDNWQDTIERRLETVESILFNLQSVPARTNDNSLNATSSLTGSTSTMPGCEQTTETDLTASSDLTCSLGAFPASSVHGLAQDKPAMPKPHIEKISSNTITVTPDDILLATDDARAHFLFFQTELDSLIFGVIKKDDSIQSVSLRCPFLAFTLCTTAAYCTNADDYSTWRTRLKELVMEKTFSTIHSFDEVRACCVAAFWLDDMATVFNALAVRLASELNLHRCVTKMPHTKIECYERTRLYFLVCIVDHTCSITFGRPPLTHGIKQNMSPRQLLQCAFIEDQQSDLRLISSFELWAITANVFDNFGADIERYSVVFVEDISSFEVRYDKWVQEWSPIVSPVASILGSNAMTPSADQIFHLSQLATRLFLYSHVFRGPGQRQGQPPTEFVRTTELQTIASHSIQIAAQYLKHMAILIKQSRFLEIAPSYLGLTTAYASMLIHRTSRLSELTSHLQDSTETLTELYRVLQTVLRERDNSAVSSVELGKPLVRLVQMLRRQMDRVEDAQDLPMAVIQYEHNDNPQSPADDVHFHFDNGLIDDSFFSTNFTSLNFSGFDSSSMFDWPLA